jgi:DNA polymerase III sliding clamp (beta) subunit (PCNA family)
MSNEHVPNDSIAKKTLEALIASFYAASSDATRFNLAGTLVTANEGKVKLVATNGHIMSVVEIHDLDAARLIGKTRYFVTREELPVLKLLLKEIKRIGVCPAGQDGESLILHFGAIRVTIKNEKACNVTYPDFDLLFKGLPYPEETPTIGLNPEYLIALYKSMGTEGNQKKPQVKLTFKDKLSPIVVKVGDHTGLLMPMRI